MNIVTGKFFINKTRKFLLPCLGDYGDKMKKAIDQMNKLAVGTGDINIIDSIESDNIFILVDLRQAPTTSILQWMRKQPFFVKDYPFDDILTGYQQMIVVKIPDDYVQSKIEFNHGNYSRMYTKKQIDSIFGNTYMDILVKDENTLKNFVDTINHMYESNIQYELWEGEVDFPPKMEEEVFNIS